MSHMSDISPLGLLLKYQEKKKKNELASNRPVGFAAGKKERYSKDILTPYDKILTIC